ncbi:MAG: hypothetical protein JSU67_03590, partial [Gammaproteobacteria bacterium]
KLDEMHRQQKARSAEILSIMSKELEKSLDKLDLSARQETALKKILASSAEQTDSVYDEGLKIDEQFQGIIDELSSALNE